MRILLWTDAPWLATAYGRQARDLVRWFKSEGHEVAILAKAGLNHGAIRWNDVVVYPPHRIQVGADAVPATVRHFNADVVMSIYDVWALPADFYEVIPVPWIAYFPLDGAPCPPRAVKMLRHADYIVSYTQWGQAELRKAGLESTYIPPGFDFELFQPGDKLTARRELGFPEEAFVVSSVGANKGYPCRKSWEEILLGFAQFSVGVADALLYVHSFVYPLGDNGMNFKEYARSLGIPESKQGYPNQEAMFLNIPDSELAKIYQASDVLLQPSRAEGFGFPVVEAQACGVPVITQNAHAHAEINVNGYKVSTAMVQWLPTLQYYWRVPSPEGIADALHDVYKNPRSPDAQLATDARELLRTRYSWDVVGPEHWRPFIEKVEAELW